MPLMSVMIPPALKQEMENLPEINWSEIVRQAIHQRIEDMKCLKELTRNSRLTENDSIHLSRAAKKSVALKHLRKS